MEKIKSPGGFEWNNKQDPTYRVERAASVLLNAEYEEVLWR